MNIPASTTCKNTNHIKRAWAIPLHLIPINLPYFASISISHGNAGTVAVSSLDVAAVSVFSKVLDWGIELLLLPVIVIINDISKLFAGEAEIGHYLSQGVRGIGRVPQADSFFQGTAGVRVAGSGHH